MTQTQNSNIQILPEHIIDQIKAGEVIERPSTLLKELIENSIDANALKIDIHIVNNGMDLIEIVDDGNGIQFEDMPLAFSRHATSKLHQFEDVYQLHTYGFRGEALASIASVSKVSCRSQQPGEKPGILRIEGGQIISHHREDSLSSQQGTKIYIKDLFYNTPARLKFLQSKTSEKNHLNKILRAFILLHPHITFSIKWDDKKREVYPALEENDLVKRIQALLFKKNPVSLTEFENEYDGIQIKGFISLDSSKGNAGKHQYLFVNDRYIQDITLHKIILNSANVYWDNFQTGHYIIYLQTPLDSVDINVHPNKTVVKFFESSKVYSIVSNSIKALPPKERTSPMQTTLEQMTTHELDHDLSHRTLKYSEEMNTHQPSFDSQVSTYQLLLLHHWNQGALIKDSTTSEVYFVDLNSLYNQFLIQHLFNRNNLATPLLISTPIDYSQQHIQLICEELGQFGLELDVLDQSTLALRSLPTSLEDFPVADYLKYVFQSSVKDLDHLKQLIAQQKGAVMMRPEITRKIIASLSLSELVQNNHCKHLNEQTIRNFLK
jgi:DNA mismatch repair protein MutL